MYHCPAQQRGWTAPIDIAAGKATNGNGAGSAIDTAVVVVAIETVSASLRRTAVPTTAMIVVGAAGGETAAATGTGDAAEAEAEAGTEAEDKGDVCLRVDANTH